MTSLARGLRALGAGLLLTLLIAGVPVALLAWGDVSVLAPSRWSQLVQQPVTSTLVVAVVTVVAWVCWALLTVSVVAEVMAVLTAGRVRLRIPGAGSLQPLASVLVAAVVIGLASSHPGTGGSGSSAAGGGQPAASATATAGAGAAASSGEQRLAPTGTHVVAPGDELWTIAEHHYGDGQRWREIARANGLTADSALVVGGSLTLPDLPAAPAPLSAPGVGESQPGLTTVVVVAGDTLWSLAERHLGDPERWPEIADLNPGLVTDPDQIDVGWVLSLPAGSVGRSVDSPTEERPGTPQAQPTTPGSDETGSTSTSPRPSEVPSSQAPTTEASPVQATPAQTTSAQTTSSTTESSSSTPTSPVTANPLRRLAGGLTASLAAAVTAGLLVRRRLQHDQRDLGRRPVPASEASRRLESVWATMADGAADPDGVTATTVVVGDRDEGQPVTVELSGITVLRGDAAHTVQLLGAVCTSLVSAEWSAGTDVVVVGRGLAWAVGLDSPMLRHTPDATVELARAARRARDRRLAGADLDPDSHEVLLFSDPLTADERDLLIDLMDETPGMAAVVLDDAGTTPWTAGGCVVRLEDETTARVDDGPDFQPSLIGEPARRALVELHATTTSDQTTRAPWWADDPPARISTIHNPPEILEEASMTTVDAHRDHPTLLLLGPIELTGARGTQPARAVKQCQEYCGWLLENPGSLSSRMSQALFVAEPTRRSNMSRLRVWLGEDDSGRQYLPEAYTGRIELHPAVSSDWDELQNLVQAGVNRTPSQVLVQALGLVRGEPLADAAPGQWHWAEQWRRDMIGTIRDIALVVADRSLDSGDLDVARWSLRRGLVCAPTDELLITTLIRTEHRAGNQTEAERYVMHLTKHARTSGHDLRADTVELIQQVIEGRLRNRNA
ncbi:LysM peptidoglycan-binding domain-containing protein [Aestuariimicrobium soli]|uniref:LysM peptidoglycan-binding domain-containing protein n=1 Tax=Aestuariimicrobium soli TaxID=2035834 RepID=UPI003EB7C68A